MRLLGGAILGLVLTLPCSGQEMVPTLSLGKPVPIEPTQPSAEPSLGTITLEPTEALPGDNPVPPVDTHLAPAVPVLLPPVYMKKIWYGELEAGLNGADGNSEIFKLRVGGNVKRETAHSLWKSDFTYNIGHANQQLTEDRALVNSRFEWPFPKSPWSVFTSGRAEYDAFKAYEYRLSTYTGVSYQWVKNKTTLFKTRLGTGISRELRGPNPNNRLIPEGLVGMDFEYQLTELQKLTSTAELNPDQDRWGDYRAQARVAYEVLIDPKWNLTLKVGATDMYNSTPEGKKPNDVEYFAVLLWKY